MKSHANRVLDSIKRSLAEHLPKEGKALLFGSQARGDAQVDSDWDILILLNKEKLEPSDYDELSFNDAWMGPWRKDKSNYVYNERMGCELYHSFL